MAALLCLLVLAGPELHRVPDKAGLPETGGRPVWVFFTDKGINTEGQYHAALRILERKKHRPDAKPASPLAEPGPDFDDLPVRRDYVAEIERLGGRLRTVSRWLNAASFDLPKAAQAAVYALPFVYDLKPVADRTERESVEPIPVSRPRSVRSQALDTAMAHRFYGPSYDQAQMMGVPELFFKGYFGSGVRLAIFDTGLKLKNVGVKGLRVVNQHDFLSGDNFHVASGPGWAGRPVPGLRYLGLVKSPDLVLHGDRALLVFAADSFSYGYNAPRRAVFASRSTDAGGSWSNPVPVVMSQPASQISSHTFENLHLANADSVTYLVYNDLLSSYRARPQANAYLGYFQRDAWSGPTRVAAGRWPDICIVTDTLYFCCVESDSTIQFRKASLEIPSPNWLPPTTIRTTATIEELEIAADASGTVVLVAIDQHTGRIVQYRSADRGATFAPAEELVPSAACDIRLEQARPGLFLFYQECGSPPFSRLKMLYSPDLGANWQHRATALDSLLTIGAFAAATASPGTLDLCYETGGFLYRTASTDSGRTWQAPSLLDTAGFCYQPALAAHGSKTLGCWVKRGDDNTAWEESDTGRFASEQPDHGTRMASLICGFQQGSIVGVAPGVDLMVAKTEFHKTAGGRYYEYILEEDTYIEALEWAHTRGADIVSTSLGYRGWYSDDQLDGKTAPISRAAGIAGRKGIVVVTAMGNRDTVSYPWPKPYLTAPADAYNIIAAGGVERNLLPWRGTGTGPTADGRPKPELVALSDTVAVIAPDSVSGLEGSVGTSCATALIAGACALVKEAHPDWTADSIRAALFATATRSVQSCTFGFGVPRVDSAFKMFPPAPGLRPIPRDELLPFPNPFVAGRDQRVYFGLLLTRYSPNSSIWIYSPSGTLLDTIRLDTQPLTRPGRYTDLETLDKIGARWNGNNAAGNAVGSGLYLAVLHTTYGSSTTKFCLVR